VDARNLLIYLITQRGGANLFQFLLTCLFKL